MPLLPPDLILVKDVPGAKAGSRFSYNDYKGGWLPISENIRSVFFTEEQVYDKEWFEPVVETLDNTKAWATDKDVMCFANLFRKSNQYGHTDMMTFKKMKNVYNTLSSSAAHMGAKGIEIAKLSFVQSILSEFYQQTNRLDGATDEIKLKFNSLKNRIDRAVKEIKNEVDC